MRHTIVIEIPDGLAERNARWAAAYGRPAVADLDGYIEGARQDER